MGGVDGVSSASEPSYGEMGPKKSLHKRGEIGFRETFCKGCTKQVRHRGGSGHTKIFASGGLGKQQGGPLLSHFHFIILHCPLQFYYSAV